MDIAAWIFGGLAMSCLFAAYQQKSAKGLTVCKLGADIFWSFHYLFLGAYTGIVPNCVGIFRELIFMQRKTKKWANLIIFPILFVVAGWGVGMLTFRGPISILPLAASTVVTLGLWTQNALVCKIACAPASTAFLIYDIFVGSYIGVFAEAFSLVSLAIFFIKYFKNKKGTSNMENKKVFSPDVPTEKPSIPLPGERIEAPLARIENADASALALARGAAFADDIEAGHIGDFEKEGDKMVHVTTFIEANGMIYMTYYANTATGAEDPNFQTARLAYCPASDPSQKVILDVQSAGDTCGGGKVEMVYDTILARRDEKTLVILWTARVDGNYYRLYRTFDIETKTMGEVGVNRLTIGKVTNDFSASGIVAGFAENGLGLKTMYSDIGIMQKFTYRIENGVKYYYTGAYSGDLNFVMKSADFVNWIYVSQPSFPNLSKWENAVYIKNGKLFYFVRQQDTEAYGFLTCYDIDADAWETPVLVADSQSRADMIEYEGELYMFYAPIDREHIGILRIDTENIAKSEIFALAHMHSSCFYPFAQYFEDGGLGMSYTVSRLHVRLARFDMDKLAHLQ